MESWAFLVFKDFPTMATKPGMRDRIVTRLKGLVVSEVSLVDRPANQHARVLMAKRDESGEEEEPLEDEVLIMKAMVCDGCGKAMKKGQTTCPSCGGKPVMKSLEEISKAVLMFDGQLALDQLYRITSALDSSLRSIVQEPDLDAAAKRVAAETSLRQFYAVVSGLISAAIPGDTTSTEKSMKTEDVVKGLKPEEQAAVQKDLDAGRAAVAKLAEIEKQEAERVAVEKRRVAVEKAKAIVGKANVKPEDIADVLEKLDDKGQAVITDLLTKHNAALEHVFKETGTSNGGDTSSNKLEKAADALQKSDPKLSRPQAIDKALKADPTLYDEEGAE